MVFTSLEYLLFLPLVALVYFLTPRKGRWLWLLIASYFFYMYWKPYYIILIVGSTLVDYWAAISIEESKNQKKRKSFLLLSVVANLGLLFAFKYFNFFSGQTTELIQHYDTTFQGFKLDVLLPVGISFYTFQTLAYTIDVYRGYTKAERHIGKYALYVTFFPQLVAGPIERSKDLLSQFHFDYQFNYQRVVEGLRLILWGFFKKIVIADRLGLMVDKVYMQPDVYQGGVVWLASVFFLFQIYCDFSAYTDIAIGSARVLGIKLSKNFDNRVYAITSFGKFWREWHITLTSWFRDYVYFPLVSIRATYYWIIMAGIVTFALNGLWHGAEWTFLIWGTLNGLYIAGEEFFKKPRDQFYLYFGWEQGHRYRNFSSFLICFALANFSIIFFRAFNIENAWALVKGSFNFAPIQLHQAIMVIGPFETMIGIVLIIAMDILHVAMKGQRFDQFLGQKPQWVRWAFYLVLVHLILYLGIPPQRQFIYFEF
jgi:alginate O-acetyltransferase complex protein AlgI